MPPLPPPGLTIRLAAEGDLDSVLKIHEEAYSFDREWCSRYLYRDKYPGDHLDWAIREYRGYLSDSRKYKVYVVTSRDYGDKPISVAVWDLTPLTNEKVGKQS